jgi:hypothetical protein
MTATDDAVLLEDTRPGPAGAPTEAPAVPADAGPAGDAPPGEETAEETTRRRRWRGQRVGVHTGTEADTPARPPARARAKESAAALAAGLRHDKRHGTPLEEAPPALAQLRVTIAARAAAHSVVPGGRWFYLAYGYGVALPVSAVLYSVLWIAQAPGRAFVAGLLTVILHRCHMFPGLPAAFTHPPVVGLIAGWLL